MVKSFRILWSCFVPILLITSAAMGKDGLVVAPSVVNSRYCLGSEGAINLKVTVDFTYRNVGTMPVVLPRFSKLSGYTLYRDEADFKAHRVAAQSLFRLADIFDTLKVEPSNPSPLLFEAIPPGGTAGRMDEVVIPLGIPGKDRSKLAGKSLLLQFTLDNWPGHDHIEESRRVWGPLGTLWARQDTTLPVPVTIESRPTPVRCFPRVD
jgi:hypothetical protein